MIISKLTSSACSSVVTESRLLAFVLCISMSGCSLVPDFLSSEPEQVNAALEQAEPEQIESPQDDLNQSNGNKQEFSALLDSADLKRRLAEHLDEWDELKPSIERLVAIESDLKTLISGLSEFSAINSEPSNARALIAAPDAEPREVVEAERPVGDSFGSFDSTDNTLSTNQFISEGESVTGTLNTDSIIQPSMITPISSSFGGEGLTENSEPSELYGIHLISYKSEESAKAGWNSLKNKLAVSWGNKSPLLQESSVRGKTYYRLKLGPFSSKVEASDLCSDLKKLKQYCSVTDFVGIPL